MKALLDCIRFPMRSGAERRTERRRHPRATLVDIEGYYLRSSLLDATARRAMIVDLSREGVCFDAEDVLEKGMEISLRLRVPYTERFVRAAGRVVRVETAPDARLHRTAVRYGKLVNGEDEMLFDAILDLLA
jgi:c-di-GMP-binding flagellar brake protein YcgR